MIGKKNHMKNNNFVTITLCSIISCVMWIMPLIGNQKLMEYANPYMLISSGFTIILPVAILSYYCACIILTKCEIIKATENYDMTVKESLNIISLLLSIYFIPIVVESLYTSSYMIVYTDKYNSIEDVSIWFYHTCKSIIGTTLVFTLTIQLYIFFQERKKSLQKKRK